MISREAGLNGMASWYGFEVHRRALKEDRTDTSMSSGNDLIVKGNQVAVLN